MSFTFLHLLLPSKFPFLCGSSIIVVYYCSSDALYSAFLTFHHTTGYTRDIAVGIATSYGLDGRGVGVRVPVGSIIFCSQRRPDRLWGIARLLYNGNRGLFPRGYSGRGVKLTAHLQLVPRSRKCGSIHPLPHTSSQRGA
jgi:hypothetical protein